MSIVNFASQSAKDKAELETYLDSQNIIYNPDENGNSTSINLGMNVAYFDTGGYADLSYLGNIALKWDTEGNPTDWTTDVHLHIASKENVSGFPNETPYYPNRFAGEIIPEPPEVIHHIKPGNWTKAQIITFCEENLIAHHSSWTKEQLILVILKWFI